MEPLLLNFHYSDQSRVSKLYGERLLSLSRGYEDLVVQPGLGVGQLAVLGMVARARYLMRTVHMTADVGDVLGAAMATRALAESVLTLAWFDKDPEVGELVWMLDEIRTRLAHHKEVADEERRQGRQARGKGKRVDPVPVGASLGLLTRAAVRSLKKIQTKTRKRAMNLKRRKKRLKRMRVTSINRMPTFADRAKVAGMPWAYSLAYRFDSNAAAHPSPLAIERFLETRSDGIHILATPKGSMPDPYYVSARLFTALLVIAGAHVNDDAIQADLGEVAKRLDALAAEVAQ